MLKFNFSMPNKYINWLESHQRAVDMPNHHQLSLIQVFPSTGHNLENLWTIHIIQYLTRLEITEEIALVMLNNSRGQTKHTSWNWDLIGIQLLEHQVKTKSSSQVPPEHIRKLRLRKGIIYRTNHFGLQSMLLVLLDVSNVYTSAKSYFWHQQFWPCIYQSQELD